MPDVWVVFPAHGRLWVSTHYKWHIPSILFARQNSALLVVAVNEVWTPIKCMGSTWCHMTIIHVVFELFRTKGGFSCCWLGPTAGKRSKRHGMQAPMLIILSIWAKQSSVGLWNRVHLIGAFRTYEFQEKSSLNLCLSRCKSFLLGAFRYVGFQNLCPWIVVKAPFYFFSVLLSPKRQHLICCLCCLY